MGLNRSYREPSSIFLEAAAALGRPMADGCEPVVAGLDAIRQREFGPARLDADGFRCDHPVGEAAWHRRTAAGRRPSEPQPEPPMVPLAVPPGWLGTGALDLMRLQALRYPGPSRVMEGILGADTVGPDLPGMVTRRPLSASRWQTFLSCPHRFLYEHLLGWQEPAAARPQRELDSRAYGSLLHRVLQRFFEMGGVEFWQK
jgi:hypothetical protein